MILAVTMYVLCNSVESSQRCIRHSTGDARMWQAGRLRSTSTNESRAESLVAQLGSWSTDT